MAAERSAPWVARAPGGPAIRGELRHGGFRAVGTWRPLRKPAGTRSRPRRSHRGSPHSSAGSPSLSRQPLRGRPAEPSSRRSLAMTRRHGRIATAVARPAPPGRRRPTRAPIAAVRREIRTQAPRPVAARPAAWAPSVPAAPPRRPRAAPQLRSPTPPGRPSCRVPGTASARTGPTAPRDADGHFLQRRGVSPQSFRCASWPVFPAFRADFSGSRAEALLPTVGFPHGPAWGG